MARANPFRLTARLPMPKFAVRYLATEVFYRAIDWTAEPFSALVPVGAVKQDYGRDHHVTLRLLNFGVTFMNNVRLKSWIASVGHRWLLEVCLSNRKETPPERHLSPEMFKPERGIEITLLGTLLKLKQVEGRWRFWWVIRGRTRFSYPSLKTWLAPRG